MGDADGLLITAHALRAYETELDQAQNAGGLRLEPILLPDDPDARLDPEVCARIGLAWFSDDVFPDLSRGFFAACYAAPNLRWLQVFNAGVDHPVFTRLVERGVRLTTAAGAAAEPIAQSAVTGMLMLSRGFPGWLDAQRRRAWEPRAKEEGAELRDQTLVVLGLGGIGCEIARLGRALSLTVIGVRRTPAAPDDPVDECVPPERLREVLPRADWLAIACPLTDQTRRLIDADAIARLPEGARVLNVARGEIVDEKALIAALRSGALAGAYLDVFETEPLPSESPLWTLPNVIVTPHNSGASGGNAARRARVFFQNVVRFGRGEPLLHEVG